MKVYVFPADPYGCGHYRMIWPAQALKKQGVDVNIIMMPQDKGFPGKSIKDENGNHILTNLLVPPDADVIVFQRPSHVMWPQIINMMQQNGIAVIIDLDDDVSAVSPYHAVYNLFKPRKGATYSWQHTIDSCKLATLVTVSTQSLLHKYAAHGRGVVIDNYVPARYLDVYPNPVWTFYERTFGWAGSIPSHPKDPDVLGKTVQRVIAQNHPFYVVGDGIGVPQAFRVNEKDCHVTGGVNITDWPQAISNHLAVGIAPLEVSEFNEGKSRLKPIEYMSVGVPWIGSPRAEYRRLHEESNVGFLADNPREWREHLERLLKDTVLWQDQSLAGRAYMEDQTYEKNAWRWAEAWEYAMKLQRNLFG